MKILAFALASAAFSAILPAAPAEAAAKADFAPCAAGVPEGSRCGTVSVPEDRAKPKGRRIALAFTIVPGDGASRKADPMLVIPGGPGQSGSDLVVPMTAQVRPIAGGRDIVYLDQRGTGKSNPLTCEGGFDLLSKKPTDPAFRACVTGLQARADLRRYRTPEAVKDLEEVRAALGYKQLNLVAGSYGVRVASEYFRQYPARVRTAVLRAAYAPDFNIFKEGTANSDAELGRVLDDCAADAACAAAYPRLEAQLAEVDARLAKAAEKISLKSAGGAEQPVEVTQDLFGQMLYAMLLSAPSRQMVPSIVATAATKGFQPLAPIVSQVRDAIYGPLPVGMYLSVVCSEDAPRLRPGDLKPGRTPLSRMTQPIDETCAGWPSAPVPASFFAPLKSDVPVLILSGENDPATTVAAANRLAPMLSRAKHLVFQGTSHGPLSPPCAVPEVAEFVENASVEGVAPDCSALRLPAFAVAKK